MKSARHAVFVLDAEDALVHVPSVCEPVEGLGPADEQIFTTERSDLYLFDAFDGERCSSGERDVTPGGQILGAQCLPAAGAVDDHQLIRRRLAGVRSAAGDLAARQIDSGAAPPGL